MNIAWSLQVRLLAQRVRKRPAQVLFASAAVALGVMTLVTVLALNRSISHSVQRSIADLSGDAQLLVSNGALGVPYGLVGELQGVPGIMSSRGVVLATTSLPGSWRRQHAHHRNRHDRPRRYCKSR